MNIEKQVCSLEQAKRLHEFGIMQVSQYHHFWMGDHSDGNGNYIPKHQLAYHKTAPEGYINGHSAFTVAELGAMLPEYIGDWFLEMYKDSSNEGNGEWFLVRYVENDGIGGTEIKYGYNESTEAQARAAMLIYLLENKLTTAEDCNKRLSE